MSAAHMSSLPDEFDDFFGPDIPLPDKAVEQLTGWGWDDDENENAVVSLPVIEPLIEPAVETTTSPIAENTKSKLDYALDCIRRGWFVFPCWPRSKAPATEHGFKDSSNDEAQIRAWWTKNPNFNPTIDLEKSGLVVRDFDKITVPADQPPTFTVQTGRDPAKNNGIPGIQMYYTGSCATRGVEGGEIRSRGAYVMAPGSVHPSGNCYRVISDIAVAPSPYPNTAASTPKKDAIGTDEQEEISGYVEASFELTDIECPNGRLAKDNGGFMWHVVCPWSAEHTEKKSKDSDTSSSVIMYPSGMLIYACQHGHCKGIHEWKELRKWMEDKVGHRLTFGPPLENGGFSTEFNPINEPQVERPVETYNDGEFEYDMTEEELEKEYEKEYPVLRLKEGVGPHFDESILYGPVGHVAKKISEYNECYIGAIYLNLIVSFGNMFGRHAYFTVNDTKHFLNEYVALIGESATARKGTGDDSIMAFLRIFDSDWMVYRNLGGYGSSQSIINDVRDTATFQKRTQKKGVHTYETITVPGVTDKRLCIRESELSNLLKLMSAPGERADEVIRDMWDGKPLRNRVAGKTKDGESQTLTCREPHGSVVGYTTPSLIKACLPVGHSTSGTGNRLMFGYLKQTKLIPNGGPQIDWASEKIIHGGETVPLLIYFFEMVTWAKKDQYIPLTEQARKHWVRMYVRLEKAGKRKGFAALMVRRASPHVRRVAAILALIDKESAVRVEHLEAAEALWGWCVESAHFTFMGYTADQERILGVAAKAGKDGISGRDLHALFNRHKTAQWLKTQTDGLISGGYLRQEGDKVFFKKW